MRHIRKKWAFALPRPGPKPGAILRMRELAVGELEPQRAGAAQPAQAAGAVVEAAGRREAHALGIHKCPVPMPGSAIDGMQAIRLLIC